MSKCNKCKYEYHPMIATPCVFCREQYGEGNLEYITFGDKFQPKEKSVIEHDGCNECLYEHLSEFQEPCLNCKHRFPQSNTFYSISKDYFKPKEEKGHSSNCTISSKECNKTVTDGNYGFEKNSNNEIDMVNHPPHYQHGIEPIEFIESHNLNFNLGSAVKYIARAPYKGKELEDLAKAKWFIEREIKRHDK
jgi:hypothetical protein